MKLIFTFLTSLIVFTSLSQNTSLSLQQSIDYALVNQQNIKNAELDIKSSKAKIGETRSIGLPQASLSVNFMDNIKIQNQFIPANAFNPTAPGDLVLPLAFGVKYSTNASVSINQLIFSASYLIGLQAARSYSELYEKSLERTKEETVLAVSKAYFNALLVDQQVRLLRENKIRLDLLYKDTKVLYENGFREKVDLQRIELETNTLNTQIENLVALSSLSKDLLKFQMGMPLSENIELSQTIDQLNLSTTPTTSASAESRIEYQQLKVQLKLYELDMKNTRLGMVPTLAAFANLGANYGALDFSKTWEVDKWKNYSMVGINLSMPLFTSFSRTYKLQQNRVNVMKVENQMKQFEQAVELEVRQKNITYQENLKNIETKKKNIELAKEVYRVSQIKYKEGLITNFELISAEKAVTESEIAYLTSVHEALITQVELQKATGTLSK